MILLPCTRGVVKRLEWKKVEPMLLFLNSPLDLDNVAGNVDIVHRRNGLISVKYVLLTHNKTSDIVDSTYPSSDG